MPTSVTIMNPTWMRQAIHTRYVGPTNHQGSRVIVTAQAGRMTVPWDDGLGPDENHAKAAAAFADKWGWAGKWYGGASAKGDGYVFVIDPHS